MGDTWIPVCYNQAYSKEIAAVTCREKGYSEGKGRYNEIYFMFHILLQDHYYAEQKHYQSNKGLGIPIYILQHTAKNLQSVSESDL